MDAFINFYEREQKKMRGINAAPTIRKALDLFAQAEAKVDAESVYGKRIALFSEGLETHRKWYETIKDGRKYPPVFHLADVATEINEEEGFWTIEARVPFTASEQDPLHEIIGPVPSAANPWYFNVCRKRLRDEGREMSAFAPNRAGTGGFHNILQFGKLVPEGGISK